MSFAVSLERSQGYAWRRRTGSLGRRLAIVLALVSADLLCFGAADFVLYLLTKRPALTLLPGSNMGASVVDLLAAIALVFVITRYLVGDYSRRQLFWDGARATTKALMVWGFVYVAAMLMSAPGGFVVSVLVWVALIFMIPTARQVTRALLVRVGLWNQPTAILGTSLTAQEVCPVLNKELSLGLDVRWVVPEKPETRIPPSMIGLRAILAAEDDLVPALAAAGCRQVILVPDDRLQLAQGDLIDQLIGAQIGVAIVPSLRRLPLFGLSTSYFFGKDLLLLQVRNNLGRFPQRFLKRSIDIAAAIVILALLSPILLVIALLVRKEDGGPVFFKQYRVGRGGRDFLCWKFRTMAVDAEDQLARWAKENPLLYSRYRESNFKLAMDPRVTRVGRWLRRTSFDELPQLINVLLGEMSLVGPRPLIRRELPDYGAAISLYERVRPGITGLWQISGRSHTTFAERVSYDEWYIKNWTVWYDIVIMLQTGWVLARGNSGAY